MNSIGNEPFKTFIYGHNHIIPVNNVHHHLIHMCNRNCRDESTSDSRMGNESSPESRIYAFIFHISGQHLYYLLLHPTVYYAVLIFTSHCVLILHIITIGDCWTGEKAALYSQH